MNKPYTIQKELQDLNSRLPSEKIETYSVPPGYFENLATNILAKVKGSELAKPDEELESLSPLLASISRKMPFEVPANYFSQTINQLPDSVQNESLPAFLAQHNRQLPYIVPEGYFENLAQQVIVKVTKPAEAKVVSFGRPMWMKYAVAAAIIGLITLSIFYFQGNSVPSIDPVKHPHEWVAKTLQNVSNKDLEQFINTTDISTNNQQIAKNRKGNSEVRQMLNNVSTNELDAFLSEMPSEPNESLIN